MQPQDRVDSILSHAASLVMEEGVSAVTIDRISQLANISRSLVYNYFKDSNELLTSLFEQVRKNYREQQEKAVERSKNFEELLRFTIRTTLHYYLDHGELIVRLTNEPAIANVVLQTEEEMGWQQNVDSYYAKQLVERYNMPEDVAVTTFQMLEGLAESVGLRAIRRLGKEGIDFLEEIVYTANIAALRAIGRKYGAASQATVIDEAWLEDAQSVIEDIAVLIAKKSNE